MRGSGAAIIGAGALVLLVCAGCARAPGEAISGPSSSSSGVPSGVPTAGSTPAASPTPTPSATVFLGTGRSLRYSCDELIDPDVIGGLDAQLRVNDAYIPAVTTSAEQAVAIQGSACQWSDAKTGTTLIVTAAHPDPPTLQTISATTASYAKPTSMFGNNVAGYLANYQVEIFTRSGYWATATSPLFSDLGVARTVMAAVEQSLPIG